jgi:hypothetical protein
MSHGVDFVAGVYRQRRDDEIKYPVRWSEPRAMCRDLRSRQTLLPADFVPGGFWRLSRACVEQANCSSTTFVDPTMPDIEIPWVFDFEREGGTRLSEDYVFCKKWRSIGGSIFVDPVLCIDHTGLKTFPGNLIESLRQETAAYNAAETTTTLDRAKLALAS